MKLSELISKHGDDAVVFQNLDNDMISGRYNHKTGTTITFGTSEQLGPERTGKLGLVVWLDRDKVAAIIAAEKQEQAK